MGDKILFRPVREYLYEAMEEVVEVEDIEHLFSLCHYKGDKGKAKIEFTYQGFDKRIGWESYLVSIDGSAIGYTNKVICG